MTLGIQQDSHKVVSEKKKCHAELQNSTKKISPQGVQDALRSRLGASFSRFIVPPELK